jgi:hypothetical protein
MRPLVHQHAAALADPGAAPAGRAIVGGRAKPGLDAEHAHQLAQLAALDQRAGRHNLGPEAELEADRQDAPGRLGGGDHGVGGGHLDGDRLLDQHMRAGREAIQRDRRVERVRRADHRHVGADLGQHFVVVDKEWAAYGLGARRTVHGVEVGHRSDLCIGKLRERLDVGWRDHATATNQGVAQRRDRGIGHVAFFLFEGRIFLDRV